MTNQNLEELDPHGFDQQERIAQLFIAYLTANPERAMNVFLATATDHRGEVTALKSLVIALVDALVEAWSASIPDMNALLAKVEEQLLLIRMEREMPHE